MPIYNKAELSRSSQNYGFVRDTFDLDAFYYQYQNAGGNRDMIKIELNYSLRAHILEPVYRSILPDVFSDSIKIHILDPMEIFAAKGNALISRAAARDLYDWGNLIESDLFADKRDLFRKCFLFYASISSEKLNSTFHAEAIDTLTFSKIRRDLFPVLRKKDNFQLEKRKIQAKNYITDLMQLTENEQQYLKCFTAKKYRPELIFDNPVILDRLKDHPMALWKCRE